MKFQNYLNYNIINEDKSSFIKEIARVKSFSWTQAKKLFINSWMKFRDYLKSNPDIEKKALIIINKHLDTNYKKADDVKLFIKESDELNESFWDHFKTNLFGAVSFYPALGLCLELDKVVKGQPFNTTIIITFSVFWLLLISGKYLKNRKNIEESYNINSELILENVVFLKQLHKLKNMSWQQVKKILMDSWFKFKEEIQKNDDIEKNVIKIINKHFKTNYKNLDSIKINIRESNDLNEGIKDWWSEIKLQGFPPFAFFPALMAWFEIEKLIRGLDFDIKTLVIYSMLWLLIITGNYLKGKLDMSKSSSKTGSSMPVGDGGMPLADGGGMR